LELHLFLAVTEFGDDPKIVTEMIGVQPSESWIRGDPMPNHPTARRTHSRWALHSGLHTSAGLEEQLLALLEKLESVGDRVRDIAAQFIAVVWAAAYTSDNNPGFGISPDLATRLGELGLGIDFDIYCLNPEKEG
jgi:uncharacterized protein DUF4279